MSVGTIDEFVHLHLHTQYSLLDGAIRLPDLVARTKELGMKTVAVTDHGNMFGAIEFYDYAKKNDIKPIVGVEAYVAPGSRHDRKGKPEDAANHITLIALDQEGYRNLCSLVSAAYLEGFYYKPRLDKELLQKYHKGIYCLSGCLKGEVCQKFVLGDDAGAKAAAKWYQDLFGKENYALEMMENGVPEQAIANEKLIALAKEIDAPLVATGDCHYLRREDAPAHDALLCIGTGKLLADVNRMRFNNDGYYVKSPKEIASDFRHHPDAVKNTLMIAEKANLKFDFGKYHFPIYPGSTEPGAPTLDEIFAQQARAGLNARLPLIRLYWQTRKTPKPGSPKPDEIEDVYGKRLEYEIAVIQKMGFSGYFLIVADFINWAKDHTIPVGPGRGSAAGSLAAYSMRITDIDPIPYDLLFERFLNPERVSMPDIDVDFCINGRGDVIKYVNERYGGSAYVSQIITFGKMQAKAAIRDIGRVLGLSFADTDRIAKLVPNILNITLDQAIEQSPGLKELCQKDAQVDNVMKMAKGIEGLCRNASVHAAGVVISDKPLTEYLPLYRGKEGETVTQFDMKWVEKVGLIKFDFLGLKTLTMMTDAVRRVVADKNPKLVLDTLPMDDEGVFQLLSRGDADGVFQLESSGMRDLLMKLKPSSFEDIVALVALYRPGPLQSGMVQDFIDRKHGRTKVEYPLPELETILKDTYGVIVYQEQVMQIANALAGYTLGDADLLRRAMGKKNAQEMANQREKFMKGAAARNFDPKKAGEIFDLMEKFAGYGFNRCVVGETSILDAETGEPTTVGDLFTNRRPFKIQSLDDQGKLRVRDVTDVMWNGKKPVFELRTAQGRAITATANHPFLSSEGWRNLGELGIGDRIAAPRPLGADQLSSIGRHTVVPRSAGNLALATDRVEWLDDEWIAQSDVFWDRVVSIEPKGVQDTYDLTVDVDHNFVADGLIVHNSHSAAYALVSFQTAYLKAHYPAEFMAALLTIDAGNSDKVMMYVNSCRDRGIPVLPPDVNESQMGFSVVGNSIRFGLSAVKNVGEGAIEAILEARKKLGGGFKSLAQFCSEVDLKRVNRRVVESLAKCGAFNSLPGNPTRAALLTGLDVAMEYGQRQAKERDSGQTSLFGGFGGAAAKGGTAAIEQEPKLPSTPELPEKERLALEKEALGFYISGHPLQAYSVELKRYTSGPITSLMDKTDGCEVKIAGIVASLKEIKTKKGDMMAFITVEDLTGATEVTVFPDCYRLVSAMLKADDPVLVIGTLEKAEEAAPDTGMAIDPAQDGAAPGEKPKNQRNSAAAKILAKEIKSLADVRAKATTSVRVHLREEDLTAARLGLMKDALKRYVIAGGNGARCPVYLHVLKADRFEAVMPLPDDMKVPASDDVLTEFEKIFGRSVASFF